MAQTPHALPGDLDVDVVREVAYANGVAVPAALLKQLLMLGDRERIELAPRGSRVAAEGVPEAKTAAFAAV